MEGAALVVDPGEGGTLEGRRIDEMGYKEVGWDIWDGGFERLKGRVGLNLY